jgi:hypothetical protein
MKRLSFSLVVALILLVQVPCAGQEEALKPEWLIMDYRSVELMSVLASPASLSVPRIKEIMNLQGEGEERDLGFGGSRFYLRRGNGYSSLSIQGLAFKGQIAFYKVEIEMSRQVWSQIRGNVIDIWMHNRGPKFTETETGLVYTERNEAVYLKYESVVSAELGEVKSLEVPNELKPLYDHLISPMRNGAIGDLGGEHAIASLLKANRIDLLENALRGLNATGRIMAARALLKLSKHDPEILSPEVASVIAKIRKLPIEVWRSSGCIVTSVTAEDVLKESEEEGSKPN